MNKQVQLNAKKKVGFTVADLPNTENITETCHNNSGGEKRIDDMKMEAISHTLNFVIQNVNKRNSLRGNMMVNKLAGRMNNPGTNEVEAINEQQK